MNALPLPLPLHRYAARRVLLHGDAARATVVERIEITVFGENFPIRAIEPEILVADQAAHGVAVAADRHSIRGYLGRLPADGATIRVIYGDSQAGELRAAFRAEAVQPLPTHCGTEPKS
jgi:hypothetical protein